MRIALAQIDTTVGDFEGNLRRIRAAVGRARAGGADVVVFPELALCGYPPLDLLDRHSFLAGNQRALEALQQDATDLAIVVGAVMPSETPRPRPVANAAVVLESGRVTHVQAKTLLPTYDVFDEARYFAPAPRRSLWRFRGRAIGLTVCEDVWSGEFWGDRRPYDSDPVAELKALGAELILNVSASPFEHRKLALREAMLADAARRHSLPIVFVNLVGANDELIFDGASFAVSAAGDVVTRLRAFEEDLALVDPFAPSAQVRDEASAAEPGRTRVAATAPEGVPAEGARAHQETAEEPGEARDTQALESALVIGIRGYMHKQGFERVVVGLSGGIDSAVTAYLATRALGAENVLGILMPGPFSSQHSVDDARSLAQHLEIESRIVPIHEIYQAFLGRFRELFDARPDYGLTQENVQARIRGALLMAVSNFENRIVLATGNKSELSVGYTTLYGDLVGGVAVLGDVLKRDVYALARRANRLGEIIPWSTIEKPPSAELRPDQTDQDSLPPYAALDEVLHQILELGVPAEQLQSGELPGVDRDTLRWVLTTLDRSEYKRRQAPIVLRVSPKAFGIGRRIPIAQRCGWWQ